MELPVPKSRTSKAADLGINSSGMTQADLGRLLGGKMRQVYDASLPVGPLPDDLARLVESLKNAGKALRVIGKP